MEETKQTSATESVDLTKEEQLLRAVKRFAQEKGEGEALLCICSGDRSFLNATGSPIDLMTSIACAIDADPRLLGILEIGIAGHKMVAHPDAAGSECCFGKKTIEEAFCDLQRKEMDKKDNE